jgi:putative FmdB family regulatory protein
MIYEYECPGCGDVRQIERKITDPEETYICTGCDNEFRRKWTAPAVSFKGTGWGKDD